MTEHSDSYLFSAPPMLDADGVTIWVKYHGRSEEGIFFDRWEKLTPGHQRYDELLPQARLNAQEQYSDDDLDDDEEEQPAAPHPETLSMLLEMQRRTRERGDR
ncbi:hypothetical protein [Kitasatospora viridis]|uniref:Uncharacterized protein n=1 Tax=Kitasatospora viridis TaxID=281105 RepID=A0A561UHK9_9ACTN|nr:hypothetical protein [Kitasatospora viridis]TWF98848.1 hypothetical protein FHX73_112675 [Kitasatospora viridis]